MRNIPLFSDRDLKADSRRETLVKQIGTHEVSTINELAYRVTGKETIRRVPALYFVDCKSLLLQ